MFPCADGNNPVATGKVNINSIKKNMRGEGK